MQAQRLLLDRAACAVANIAGPVLELGLGNGRTYHHLREKLPERRIIAFDIKVTAHQDSVPPAGDLVLGDIRETAHRFIGCGASLIHADIGSGVDAQDEETRAWLSPLIPNLLAPGGLVISGLSLADPRLSCLSLPAEVEEGRYFLYRRN